MSHLIKRHLQDKSKHHEYMKVAEDFIKVVEAKTPSIVSSLSSAHQENMAKNRHILSKIIEVILLCSRQNIPLRGHTEDRSNFYAILQTLAKTDDVLAQHLAFSTDVKYTSPDVQNEIINICADQTLQKLKSCYSKAPFFAILADETQDKSTKVQFSVCIRFVDTQQNSEIKEIFLGFLHAKHTTGDHIAGMLHQFMQNHELQLQKLRAQGYDGGSNMSGKHNGVQAIIKRLAPEALYVHCKAHCLNLAVVHACKEPIVRTMMAVVQECGFAFHYSAKRLEAFVSELQGDGDVQDAMQRKTKLKSLCETRWTSRSDALTTFKNALPVVVNSLEHLTTLNDDKAALHLSAVLRFEFIIGLVVCEHILRLVVHLSFFLQDPTCDMLAATEECRVVLTQLNAERNDPLVWDALFEEASSLADKFDLQPTMPRRAPRQQNRANLPANTPSEYWKRALFYVFMDHLIQQLDERLLGAEDRYQAFFLLPFRLQRLDDAKIASIYETFKTDIPGDFDFFKAEVARWQLKWGMNANLPSSIVETLDTTNKALYPSMHAIFLVLLTMPVATATVERSFSVLKRVKTYLRSTMGQERLSSLALLHIHREVEINVDQIINEFASAKNRKWKFF